MTASPVSSVVPGIAQPNFAVPVTVGEAICIANVTDDSTGILKHGTDSSSFRY